MSDMEYIDESLTALREIIKSERRLLKECKDVLGRNLNERLYVQHLIEKINNVINETKDISDEDV